MSMSWESYHDLRDSDGPPEYEADDLPEPITLFDAGFGGQDITVYPWDACDEPGGTQ